MLRASTEGDSLGWTLKVGRNQAQEGGQ
jgi:hypothetical protein